MRIISVFLAIGLGFSTTTLLGANNLFNLPKAELPKSTECSCPCKPAEIGLTEPNLSDIAVLIWANEAIVSAFTYNFVDYKESLQTLTGFFTTEGYDNYIQTIDKIENIEAVKAKKLIISAVSRRPPIVLQKGLLNGSYTWRVQMPTLVTYQSAAEYVQQKYKITVLITRVPTLNAPQGIAISQIVVESDKDE